jgi:hypothetical protein
MLKFTLDVLSTMSVHFLERECVRQFSLKNRQDIIVVIVQIKLFVLAFIGNKLIYFLSMKSL